MKVLLTGGAGYIGSHTAIELLQAGYEIICVDNFSNSKPEAYNRIKMITSLDFRIYECDVCERAQMNRVFEENKIDAVVHFAGYKAVGESVEKPLMYYRNNLDSTLALLELMDSYDVRRFVFSSSATVYGNPISVPMTEDMPSTGCASPYGRTKQMIEEILTDWAVANDKLSVMLLRYFNPVGAHESGLIGEDPKGLANNLMPYITQVAVGKLEYLNVFGDDYDTKDGTGVRDYIHVVDLAKGHLRALDYSFKNTGVELFNLGTGIGYSVLDIVNTFKRVNNIDLPYRIAPRRPGDIGEYYADPAKAQKILGWKAEKTLEDICRDAWNWQKNNPDGL